MEKIVAISGQRTPFGAFGGSLKDVSAVQLTVAAGRASLAQAGLSPAKIDHVIIGNVVQSGPDAIYLPRHAALHLDIPVEVGALTVNRLCGSGFQSWVSAAQMLMTAESKCVLAGGVEQMSQIPYVLRNVRFEAYRMGNSQVEDFLTTSLTDAYTGSPMAITAENLAEKYDISREACDEYSMLSQKRYAEALAKGVYATEMTNVKIASKKGDVIVDKDEHPKPNIAADKIKAMKPLFKPNGTVTAATASGIVDGAACSVLTTESEAKRLGVKPRVRVLGWASVGCDPKIMGIGPVYAIRKVLDQAQMKLSQIDLVEVNEAFAAQYLSVEKELGLERSRTNVNGGAIAVGHPLGASGTRIMNHLMYELERRQARYAIGSACIGGGQGIAILIERI